MPPSISHDVGGPLTWAAVKNKFFVQCLAVVGGFDGCKFHAARDTSSSNNFVMSSVSADALFEERTLQPGESFSQEIGYYAGPKKFSELRKLGYHQDKVMLQCWRGWEWWRSACVGMLWLLNWLYMVIPNYGVGIIVLTLLVRVVFWPLTHKSAQSMKKMQEIQPLVNKVREKYKDKPQKMNQEVMALYKEHKVNPMAGCLPMVIQMPVFIAMFTVLRSAVELRFAPFLWIKDLSGPERMFEFGFVIPLVNWDSFNLLPLVMTGLTLLQQRLTPTAGDPQQQKMMMFMPVFFLFIFYNMPAALVLYWSISQAIAVLQLVLQRRKAAAAEASKERAYAGPAATPGKGKRRK